MTEFERDKELIHKLNRETAKIGWSELQRFYAQGLVIAVAEGVDLIKVARSFANDDSPQVEAWLATGSVARVVDDQAARWLAAGQVLWAVVVAPWVLVQEVKDGAGQR